MKFFYYLLGACMLTACSQPLTEVSSPDSKIKLTFSVNGEGVPQYKVDVEGKPFIETSDLGFDTRNGFNLSNGFEIVDATFKEKDETWEQPWGENKKIHDHHNEMAVRLQNKDKVDMVITFRLFNDGLGFRYNCTTPATDSLFITDEKTAFHLASDGTSWSIPANFETYELVYRTLPISQVDNANTPFTFRTDTPVYASIHEAALTDFPEMTLKSTAPRQFKAELAPWPDGIKARFAGNKFQSPWRSIQIAGQAVGLINSGLILNLNEPCVLESTDWIKPMKYVGVWWGMHLGVESWVINDRHGATTENALRYIDFAAANNIEAVLFEGWNQGWETWGANQTFNYTAPYADFDMDKITRYAREKGIQIIGHHETGGNVPYYEAQLDSAYHWYADRDIHCVKTGYAGGFKGGYFHHSQYGVRHYRKVVETAARYHTTLDVHEPIKPTGIRRTYPNMMTREGARGMEWNAWSEGNSPEHYTILPFTRLLGGPMDYTPGIFDLTYERAQKSPDRKQWNMKDSKDCRNNTTLAKQIANWVVLYSPLQMAADMIENYEGHPAFQFFRDFNADCDWSKAISGEPGEYLAVVRRAGYNFYLGAVTNEEARTIDVPLNFLEAGRKYTATIYADGKEADWKTNPYEYEIIRKEVTSEDTLTVRMASGGGQAITFIPVK